MVQNRSDSYSIIADYYDKIFASAFDYGRLGRHLSSIIAGFAPKPGKILELGAGSCPLAHQSVYPNSATVIYSDLSPRMLTMADGSNIDRVAADARNLPFQGTFDICVMVMDALNYLLEEEDVSRCFGEVLRVLKPGGLFIVNIASESACLNQLRALVLEGTVEGLDYSLHSDYDAGTRRLLTRFTLFPPGMRDSGPVQVESHEQHIYGQDTIHRLALIAGFKVRGCFENHTLGPANGESEVIHFALQRPE